ncbi:hypothetical protein [Leucobacter musarum]|uniref:hypothetical protein n=1 Tax=Leucobacter musarum TaxID=1930747 RepID=UPI0006A7EBC9|nr:hypothetical protein [Leucobacter musarum]
MTVQDPIGATDDSRDLVWSLANYNPNAPTNAEMGSVSGTQAASAQLYVEILRRAGQAFAQEASRLLAKVQSDCTQSAEIIDAMHSLDAEIATALNTVDVQISSKVSNPSDAADSSGSDGNGKDSW